MKKFLGVLLFSTILASAAQVLAFSNDDKTMGSEQSSANFSDPDEKTPGGFMTFGGSSQFQNGDSSNDNNAGQPLNARPADPFYGSYAPRRP